MANNSPANDLLPQEGNEKEAIFEHPSQSHPEIISKDPVLAKYLEPEKVEVRLVRNCGILLEETVPPHDVPLGRRKSKKDSIFQLYHPHKCSVEVRRTPRNNRRKKSYIGLFMASLSSLFYSFVLILSKVLMGEKYGFHPLGVSLWRYLGIFLPGLIVYLLSQRNHNFFDFKNIKHSMLKMAGGVSGWCATVVQLYSFDFLNVGDSCAIVYSSALLIPILAFLFLGERKGLGGSVCLLFASLCGVALICRPPWITNLSYESRLWVGTILGTGSALFNSAFSLILYRNARHVHWSLFLFVWGGVGIISSFSVGWTFSLLKMPVDSEWLWVGVISVLSFLAQVFQILAVKFGTGGGILVVRSLEVFLAFVWEIQFLDVYPDIYSGMSSGIIIACIMIFASYGFATNPPEEKRRSLRLASMRNNI